MSVLDFFKSKLKHSDNEVSISPIKYLDQKSLLKLFLEDENFAVKKAAIKYIVDPVHLNRGRNKLKNQDIDECVEERLKELYKDSDTDTRLNIIREIRDQAFLSEIVMKDNGEKIRSASINRIFETALLQKLYSFFKNDSDIRIEIVRNISDQSFLSEIAMEDNSNAVRLKAISKISEIALLRKLYSFFNKDYDTCIKVVRQVNDQSFLSEILLEGNNTKVRSEAINRIDNQEFLQNFYASEDCPDDLKKAVRKRAEVLMVQNRVYSICSETYNDLNKKYGNPFEGGIAFYNSIDNKMKEFKEFYISSGHELLDYELDNIIKSVLTRWADIFSM